MASRLHVISSPIADKRVAVSFPPQGAVAPMAQFAVHLDHMDCVDIYRQQPRVTWVGHRRHRCQTAEAFVGWVGRHRFCRSVTLTGPRSIETSEFALSRRASHPPARSDQREFGAQSPLSDTALSDNHDSIAASCGDGGGSQQHAGGARFHCRRVSSRSSNVRLPSSTTGSRPQCAHTSSRQKRRSNIFRVCRPRGPLHRHSTPAPSESEMNAPSLLSRPDARVHSPVAMDSSFSFWLNEVALGMGASWSGSLRPRKLGYLFRSVQASSPSKSVTPRGPTHASRVAQRETPATLADTTWRCLWLS